MNVLAVPPEGWHEEHTPPGTAPDQLPEAPCAGGNRTRYSPHTRCGHFEDGPHDGLLIDAPILSTGVFGLVALLLCLVCWRLLVRLRQVKCQSATLAEQAHLLDLAYDAILVWELKTGAIRFWNRGAEQLYGWPREDVLGRTPQAILQTIFPEPLADINARLVQDGRWEGELVHHRRDGTAVAVASRWALQVDDRGHPSAVLGINSDITRRKEVEAALHRQALHDPLTRLPNRTLFYDRLTHALAHAERTAQRVAVLFLDLDNFKVVNDSLGHQAGDALLVEVGNRLQTCVRASDTVARLGGDEFTLLLEMVESEAEVKLVGARIAAALKQPITLGERQVVISASIGVAISVARGTVADRLVHDADAAMYQSKAAGKARLSVFQAA